jgi:hypothetical protein
MAGVDDSPQDGVEQWGILELSLDGPTKGNPFLDVRFGARFYQEDTVIEASGFYDGDGSYRVRFMPDKPGQWQYVTQRRRAAMRNLTVGTVRSSSSSRPRATTARCASEIRSTLLMRTEPRIGR